METTPQREKCINCNRAFYVIDKGKRYTYIEIDLIDEPEFAKGLMSISTPDFEVTEHSGIIRMRIKQDK